MNRFLQLLGRHSRNRMIPAAMLALLVTFSGYSNAEESLPKVQLDAQKAAPRSVEPLTERAIIRDYRVAWSSISHALEFNVMDPLEGPFTGEARRVLRSTVSSQQQSGMRQRYLDQNHRLEAVFYAPEGDVIELHDTAEYQHQILDGPRQVQDERVVLHYIVLMTPSADRWVVRQLRSVPEF